MSKKFDRLEGKIQKIEDANSKMLKLETIFRLTTVYGKKNDNRLSNLSHGYQNDRPGSKLQSLLQNDYLNLVNNQDDNVENQQNHERDSPRKFSLFGTIPKLKI